MGNDGSKFIHTEESGAWSSSAGTCKCKAVCQTDLFFTKMRYVVVPMANGGGAKAWNGFANTANAIIPDKVKVNGDFKEYEHDAVEITYLHNVLGCGKTGYLTAEYNGEGWALNRGKYQRTKRVPKEEDIARFSFNYAALENICAHTRGNEKSAKGDPTYSLVKWNCSHWAGEIWRKIIEWINKNR